MHTHETITTPDGPFTVVEREDGAVVAAGWSEDPTALLARAGLASPNPQPGTCVAADAVRAYYAGDAAALANVWIHAEGTDFQRDVWEALRAIPAGEVRRYGDLASAVGNSAASRAVGAACGANALGLFIPCHRAVGASGALTGFAWGLEVKRSLLAREGATLA